MCLLALAKYMRISSKQQRVINERNALIGYVCVCVCVCVREAVLQLLQSVASGDGRPPPLSLSLSLGKTGR